MNRLLRALLVLALLPAALAARGDAGGLTPLTVGDRQVRVMVARTTPERMVGLMYRTEMPEDQGMLFAYPVPALHAMWMKNTRLPLAVAFIDREGVILNIEEMQPETLDAHAAAAPASYSLEMNGGWFARHNIGPGAKIRGLERIPPAE